MVGDTVITGSDDWTARIWSVSRGACDAVLACHAGPILCVEYSSLDRGIITGMYLQFWLRNLIILILSLLDESCL
jgi:WD40 repeat protein